MEHIIAIARAFGMAPMALALGTDAAKILSEWVPRAELEQEANLRADAQAELANTKIELAGVKAQIATYESTVNELTARNHKAEMIHRQSIDALQKELSKLRALRAEEKAIADAAKIETAQMGALARASQMEASKLRSLASELARNLHAIKEDASNRAWLNLAIGGIAGLAMASAEIPAKNSKKRRTRS